MKKVIALFIFAFLLRLVSLNQSLWLDEGTTAITVKTLSGWDIVTKFSLDDFHPPLYYLFMDVWTSLFGYSEIALRMPSVFASLCAGIFVCKSTKILFHRHAHVERGAFFATLFFLLNPLIVYYSQEARMYALATCFISVSFYLFLRKKIILSTFFNLFAFYTFYGSLFYILSMWLFLLVRRDWKSLGFSMLVFAAGSAPLGVLLYAQMEHAHTALREVANWSSVLGQLDTKNLVLMPVKFVSGRISFEPKILYFLLAGISALCVLVTAGLPLFRKKGQHGSKHITLWFFFCVPILFGIIASLSTPLLQFFRFQFVILFLSMILGGSVIQLSKARIIGGILGVIFLSWTLVYLLFPQFHREDWKGLAGILNASNKPAYMIPSSADPLRYYLPDGEIRPLKEMRIESTERAIMVIPYTADIHGISYIEKLNAQGFTRSNTQHVRGIPYEEWRRY